MNAPAMPWLAVTVPVALAGAILVTSILLATGELP